jgi:cystathionine gamma-synthase
MRTETKAVHAGEREENRQHRSVVTPIDQTAAYYFEDTPQVKDFYEGKLAGIKYGRYGCPTQHAVERKLADMENTERALLFSSGMSAVTTAIMALARAGQHVLYTNDCYRNIRRFFDEILPNFGIETTEVPIDDMKNIEKYLKENTVLFFSELPTNPFLRVIDLEHVITTTTKRGIVSLIDSTFATPVNIRPAEYGVDLVLHSATKYLGGHHDLFAGVVAGRSKFIEKVQQYRDIFGGIVDPHTSYLLLRSMQTLPLRMKAHNNNGLEIANWLEKHPKVARVWYPGCKSHPDNDLAEKQMSGFGGVITFSLKASEEETSRFVDALRIPYIATNFGGPQSLIEQHAILTFYKDRVRAEKRGITGNLLRYSVGLENVADVLEDFENAFRVLG